jgi:hypothetical protein
VDQLDDLPDAFFAVGGDGEVDAFDLLAHATLRSTSNEPDASRVTEACSEANPVAAPCR